MWRWWIRPILVVVFGAGTVAAMEANPLIALILAAVSVGSLIVLVNDVHEILSKWL